MDLNYFVNQPNIGAEGMKTYKHRMTVDDFKERIKVRYEYYVENCKEDEKILTMGEWYEKYGGTI